MDSINRFLSASDQSALWQTTSANQYHDNYEGTGHTGYSFGTLYNLDTAISCRYGAWSSLAQYVEEAQAQNYEDTRAQFEAYIAHSTNSTQPSTGTTYWQLNKGWPTLLWSLYNNDYDQAGAYFGAQKANRTLHALYTLDTHTVTVDNLGGATQSGVTVEAKVYNTAGTLLDDQTSGTLSLASQKVQNSVLTPVRPAAGHGVLRRAAAQAERHPGRPQRLLGQHHRRRRELGLDDPVRRGQPAGHDDLLRQPQGPAVPAGLDGLGHGRAPAATPARTARTSRSRSPSPTPPARPTVGFLLRADLRRGTSAGAELSGDNEVTSAIWSDNDVTLWPGESETLTASYNSADLQGATPVVSVSGWNAAKVDVVAGTGSTTNDFSISASPATGSVTAGARRPTTVGTTLVSGTAESVALTASGLPAGVTAAFSPASVTAGGSSTLTLSSTSATTAGVYPITVTGTAASATHSANYTLTVTTAADNDFSISVAPTSGFGHPREHGHLDRLHRTGPPAPPNPWR